MGCMGCRGSEGLLEKLLPNPEAVKGREGLDDLEARLPRSRGSTCWCPAPCPPWALAVRDAWGCPLPEGDAGHSMQGARHSMRGPGTAWGPGRHEGVRHSAPGPAGGEGTAARGTYLGLHDKNGLSSKISKSRNSTC